jgi:TRAP-type C4-dicarboxylate transport system permease small subunit
MKRFIDRVCRVIDIVLAVLLALMVVLVFGNVVLRYAFNSGIAASDELSRWLFVWLTFLGALVALKERAHLGTDALISRLGRAGKKVCIVASQLSMLFVTWLLYSGTLAQMKINLDVQAAVTGASMGIFYAAGIAFAVPAALLLLIEIWRTLTGQVSDDELVMVQESEDLAAIEARR